MDRWRDAGRGGSQRQSAKAAGQINDILGGELLRRATQLVRLCREHGVLCVINDRPDLAVLSGADGAPDLGHDGHDLPVGQRPKAQAFDRFGDAVPGVLADSAEHGQGPQGAFQLVSDAAAPSFTVLADPDGRIWSRLSLFASVDRADPSFALAVAARSASVRSVPSSRAPSPGRGPP